MSGFVAVKRGQFAGASERTADGREVWRLVRVTRSSKSGVVREYCNPSDYDAVLRGARGKASARVVTRRIDALEGRHSDTLATATAALTADELTYDDRREMQLDVLRMLGYSESELVDAGRALRGGLTIAEYTHTHNEGESTCHS